ncbi:MAG: hypothetical protein WB735_04950 [Pseudonocardiaceae bacterium]
MTSTVDLLDAIHTHLAAFELPAFASVHVATPIPGEEGITVQLRGHDLPEIASALLSWADTLTAVTAHAWRVPSGHSVHLSITGQLSRGARIRVYGAMPFTGCGLGADLAPDATTTILLAALRHVPALRGVTA